MPVTRQEVQIAASPARIMAVLCDFAAYRSFVPDMEESTVLRAEPALPGQPGRWTVQFAVMVIRRIPYTLLLERHGDTRLSWSLVSGSFRSNTGSWDLVEVGSGQTLATYTLDVDLGIFVPGSVLKTLLEQTLPATLVAFKVRSEAA